MPTKRMNKKEADKTLKKYGLDKSLCLSFQTWKEYTGTTDEFIAYDIYYGVPCRVALSDNRKKAMDLLSQKVKAILECSWEIFEDDKRIQQLNIPKSFIQVEIVFKKDWQLNVKFSLKSISTMSENQSA